MKRTVVLERTALGAVLLLPLFLLHARSIAEVMIGVTDVCFLALSAYERRWDWLGRPWLKIGLAWWIWLVICSLPIRPFAADGGHAFSEAVVTVRFLIFIAALEDRVLSSPRARRWLAWVITASFLWIGVQLLQQQFTGTNIFGQPRAGDGVLTGPFAKQRAGSAFVRLFFPTVLPPVAALMARPRLRARVGGVLVLLVAIALQVLIGQRMPVLLMGLGLLVTFLIMPKLRALMAVGAVVAVVLIGASVVLSPPTYHRLVVHFSHQMSDFRNDPYGELYVRSLVMAKEHPWLGRGFDGFRNDCHEPQYFHGLTWVFTGHDRPGFVSKGVAACNLNPQNHYLQAVTDAGIPGLLLYTALGIAWLIPLARGLGRDPDPLRVSLFVAAFIVVWPIAATSSYTDMPLMGWFSLLLGWGFAEARAAGLAARAEESYTPRAGGQEV